MKLEPLLNTLSYYLIKITENHYNITIEFEKINPKIRTALDRTYDISTIKFDNFSEIRFTSVLLYDTYIHALIRHNKLEYFCDELEKRIIGAD